MSWHLIYSARYTPKPLPTELRFLEDYMYYYLMTGISRTSNRLKLSSSIHSTGGYYIIIKNIKDEDLAYLTLSHYTVVPLTDIIGSPTIVLEHLTYFDNIPVEIISAARTEMFGS